MEPNPVAVGFKRMNIPGHSHGYSLPDVPTAEQIKYFSARVAAWNALTAEERAHFAQLEEEASARTAKKNREAEAKREAERVTRGHIIDMMNASRMAAYGDAEDHYLRWCDRQDDASRKRYKENCLYDQDKALYPDRVRFTASGAEDLAVVKEAQNYGTQGIFEAYRDKDLGVWTLYLPPMIRLTMEERQELARAFKRPVFVTDYCMFATEVDFVPSWSFYARTPCYHPSYVTWYGRWILSTPEPKVPAYKNVAYVKAFAKRIWAIWNRRLYTMAEQSFKKID